jgi:hypothetical protein
LVITLEEGGTSTPNLLSITRHHNNSENLCVNNYYFLNKIVL